MAYAHSEAQIVTSSTVEKAMITLLRKYCPSPGVVSALHRLSSVNWRSTAPPTLPSSVLSERNSKYAPGTSQTTVSSPNTSAASTSTVFDGRISGPPSLTIEKQQLQDGQDQRDQQEHHRQRAAIAKVAIQKALLVD